jgi:mono/diheme cytochrome c family protein
VRSRGAAAAIVGCLLATLSGAWACRREALPETGSADRDVVAGRRIYERKCASCHGLNGDGKTVTASRFKYANLIDGVWRGDGSQRSIEQQIRKGRDPMPRFEGKLTDEEIRETASYVLELSRRGRSK